MAKQYTPVAPATRVVHYLDPAMPAGGITPLTERELLRKRAEDRVLYARWVKRQAAIAERDRKVRRFWFGFGAVVGLAGLAALGVAVWFVMHAAATLGLLAIPLALLALAGLAVGGHRCVTIVQHWH
jgi:hypothetical protein